MTLEQAAEHAVDSAGAGPGAGPGARPVAGPVDGLLADVWAAAERRTDGELATYIPQLALADPSTFGLAVATLDGHVYSVGRIEPFTIQSVSKPFVYALALADCGVDRVLDAVGVEPTGNAFNTISVDGRGRPFNPMVNAGAIVTTSLVAGGDADEKFGRILAGLSAFAGRPLDIDETVFASENETGDRNRAIAFLLRSVGALDGDVHAVLAAYFRQCSISVTARDLAVMAATLANGGTNPVTGETVVPAWVVSRVLTVMATCGMYDFAGEWLYRVGLPAKSGVSGGISAVQPGRLGVGAHSPLLDRRGNSVRGIAACELLSERLDLHMFAVGGVEPAASIRHALGGDIRSMRARVAREREVLDAQGRRIVVHTLTGAQDAASTERVTRAVVADEARGWHVLDLRRCRRMEPSSAALLVRLVEQLRAGGAQTVLVRPKSVTVRRAIAALSASVDAEFADSDDAIRWCEDALLTGEGLLSGAAAALVPIAEQDLLAGVSAGTVAAVEAAAVTRVFAAGSPVFVEGAPSDGLYFVGAGQVSAVVTAGNSTRRLSSIGPGSSFGELALIEGGTRSAT
ncbi:MAG: glutaminase, partial [Frankiaceae bacterium]|nr:glutaminase [Frankiaceae bacterium]